MMLNCNTTIEEFACSFLNITLIYHTGVQNYFLRFKSGLLLHSTIWLD